MTIRSLVPQSLLPIVVLAMVFILQSSTAFAGYERHDRSSYRKWDHHGHSSRGHKAKSHSRHSVEIHLGGLGIYYRDGLYYPRKVVNHYIVATPPVGSIVYHLPAGCRRVRINGVHYYTHNNVYYLPARGGYEIVQPHTAVVVPPTAILQPQNYVPAAQPVQNEFTINIPNEHNGYVTVKIKRSGTGFVGPQGEYYSEFPSVQQLALMYNK